MGVFAEEIAREANETIRLNEQMAMSMKRQVEVIEELELMYVEKPMKINEIAEILGVSPRTLYHWSDDIKSGVSFSFIYGFVKHNKPGYLPRLKEYINRKVRHDRTALQHKRMLVK